MDLEILAKLVDKGMVDTTLVKIFADAIEEQGWVETAKWIRCNGCSSGDGGGGGGDGDGGDGGGDGDGDGDGGGGDGDGDGGDGGGIGGGGGDGGGGDGGGIGGGDGDKNYTERFIMKDGFYITSIRGGYYPYVLIGWVERNDFLIRIRNSRVIRRFGRLAQLSQIARTGPIKGSNPTQLLELSEEEWVPLSSVSRIISANYEVWGEYCPKPENR